MSTIKSYNNIIDLFRDWAMNDEDFLKDFGYGPFSDFGTSRQMKYPAMWMDHQPVQTIQVINRVQTPLHGFTIVFVDQINQQDNVNEDNGYLSDNRQHIMSDMFQVAQDFIQFLISRSPANDMIIDGDVSLEPVEDETPDKVCGWKLDIILKTKHFNC